MKPLSCMPRHRLVCGSSRPERHRHLISGAIRAALAILCVGLVFGTASANPGRPGAPFLQSGSWIDWNGDNFFQPCRGDCALSVYGGWQVTTPMTRIFFVRWQPRPVWDWRWGDSGIVAAAFSRRLVTFWGGLRIEPEFGVGQRVGQMDATEFWAALNIRWTEFPWNRYVKTTIGIADGINFASSIEREEKLLNDPKVVGRRLVFTGSSFLNFFSPNITFALPDDDRYELMFRWHHRSGIFGLINDVHAGAQFFTAGLRVNF